jgi:hypothetical protein
MGRRNQDQSMPQRGPTPCPQAHQHTTNMPDEYRAWHEWAERMAANGYVQQQCDGCGHWVIWRKP